jgi:hypothetical protein
MLRGAYHNARAHASPHRTLDLTDTSPTPHRRHHNDDQFSFFFAITHRAHHVVRSAGNHDDA